MPPTNYPATWTELDAINDALINSNQSAEMRVLLWERTEWPHWYVQLLSQIYALTAGKPIEYITSSVRDSRIERDDVYAFTADVVIHASVTDFSDEFGRQDAKVRTTAWSRDELRELTLTGLNDYPTRDSGEGVPFPRNLRLELRYGGHPAISLPLPSFSSSVTLESVYPSLLNDLSRRTA